MLLKECKKLDINNFLHDVSPYMTNRPLPPQRAASSRVFDPNHPIVVLRRSLVETNIFEYEEIVLERSFTLRQDNPLSGEGSRKFDQFGNMQGEMHRDPDAFEPAVKNPISSS